MQEQLQGTKPLAKSKTFWGTLIAATPAILSIATGVDTSQEFGAVIDHGVPLVGAVISIIGILTRKTRVSVTGAPK